MPLITYVGPADAGGTSGLVCGSLTFDEAEAGLDLEPFDCTVNFHPVQVMKTDGEDYYGVSCSSILLLVSMRRCMIWSTLSRKTAMSMPWTCGWMATSAARRRVCAS